MYDKIDGMNVTSDELCEQMAKECDTCLLAFSLGKDSVASWLQCRKYFKNIVPFYKYNIPNLEFVEDNLQYYEDFFGQHIFRLPHPNLYSMLSHGVFQSPVSMERILQDPYRFPSHTEYTAETVTDMIRYMVGLPDTVYTAVGLRVSDSPMRRMNVKAHGALIHNKKTFYPVFDWLKDRLLREFDEAGIKLSSDYQLWNNSFDGVTNKYIKEIKEYYPRDYEKIKKFFPLVDLDILRREM